MALQNEPESTRALTVVTGGGGFIGQHLCRALLADGHKVRVVDSVAGGRRQGLADLARQNPGLELHELDVRDVARLTPVFEGASGVVHLAGQPSVSATVLDPGGSSAVNLEGTVAVLDAARSARVRRVVYASSATVYGDRPEPYKHETLRARPRSPLGVQCLAAEQYCQLYAELYGLGTVCLRLFNVYGPGQDGTSEHAGVVARYVHRLLRRQELVLFGSGLQRRDFVHVRDVVSALMVALQADGAVGRVFNIGSGESISIDELWQLIAGLCARPSGPVAADWFPEHAEVAAWPQPRRGPPRLGDVRQLCAAISRAGALLGWAPRIDLRHGLRSVVEHARSLADPRRAVAAAHAERAANPRISQTDLVVSSSKRGRQRELSGDERDRGARSA
jgi:UDP-glucose 4-epimerase